MNIVVVSTLFTCCWLVKASFAESAITSLVDKYENTTSVPSELTTTSTAETTTDLDRVKRQANRNRNGGDGVYENPESGNEGRRGRNRPGGNRGNSENRNRKKPRGRKEPKSRPSRKRVSDDERKQIKKRCRGGRCRRQRQKDQRRRGEVKHQFAKIFGRRGKNQKDQKRAEKQAELYLQQMFELKKQFIRDALGDEDAELVLPPDDGLFERDISWIPYYGLNDDPDVNDDYVSPGRGPQKRSVVDYSKANLQPLKWSMPIRYKIQSGIAASNSALIRSAINLIQNSVSCISFQETSSEVEPVMSIEALDPLDNGAGLCGFAPIGMRRRENVVSVWFDSEFCGNVKGRLVHEILHSLGVEHQHGRLDRDLHMTVRWDAIDPEDIGIFLPLHDQSFLTTYGLPYAFDSIMHYHAFVGSNSSQPSMVPRSPDVPLTLLGQRDFLSCLDIATLEKLYCCPDTCRDQNDLCSYWANTLECRSENSGAYMQANCQRSCGYCCPTSCTPRCGDFCHELDKYLP